MANGIHLSQKPAMRNRQRGAKEKNIMVKAARYITDLSLAVSFSSGRTQLVNFLPLFEKYVNGKNLKYFAPERFKKFIVKNGNISWGKNEDIVFPVSLLFKKSLLQAKASDEILYVI